MNRMNIIIIPILIIAIFFMCIPKTEYAANITFKIGDINGDGAIDSRDTLRILEHIAASTIPKIKQKHSSWILIGDKLKAADINGDGEVDSRDTLRELEYIASSTIPSIAKKNPDWKTYIEKKWTIEATGIKLDKTTLNIEKGKTSKLVATITPTNASNKVVTWSSSNTKVASVDGIGNVTAKATGVSIITAKASNGKTATSKITVNNPVIAATSISLNKTALSLNKGASGTLFATITPSNTTNKTVTWSSSNTNIVSVTNGKITAKAAGSATIIVSTSNGKKAICRVTVNNPVIAATSISLNKTSLSLNKGASETLFATITPSNTTNKTVTWSSSNTNILSVANGKITAKSAGSATIIVATSNGKKAICSVIVKKVQNTTTTVSNNKTAEKVINVMKEWKKMGGKNAHKEVIKYYTKYGKMNTSLSDNLWCSETVSAAFVKAGMVDLIGGVASYTGKYEKNFKKIGIKKGKNVTPKPGWIVCYGSGSGHTALVTKVSGNRIYYLAGGGSKIHSGSTSKGSVKFYGAPKFSN